MTESHLYSLGEMLKINKNLKALYVSVNNFGNEGASKFTEGLAQNKTLEEISFASCGIQETGFLDLIEAMRQHSNLKYIDFGYASSTKVLGSKANEISDKVAEKLLDFVQRQPQLQYLNLIRTSLSEAYKIKFMALENISVLIENINSKHNFPQHSDSKAIKSVYR
jgi:Ran GTPase-activating protein (RanGAP) involved in mRNA processing and transport